MLRPKAITHINVLVIDRPHYVLFSIPGKKSVVDLGIVIGSKDDKKFTNQINVVKSMLQRYHVSTDGLHFGIINDGQVLIPFNDKQTDKNVISKLDDLAFVQAQQDTNTSLKKALEELFDNMFGARKDAAKVLTIFVDDISELEKITNGNLVDLDQAGIKVVFVTFGPVADSVLEKVDDYLKKRLIIIDLKNIDGSVDKAVIVPSKGKNNVLI